MTKDELRATLQAVPFQPFTIRMADQRSFPIRHPDFLLIGPAGRIAFAFQSPNSFSILDLRLMTEIEVGPGQEATA
jgi:hypothetical protein